MIHENLSGAVSRIDAACKRSGRSKNEVQLILVSKTVTPEAIREAYALGIRDFGENRVQEWFDKKDLLPSDIRWHLIGHLQTNKAKFCIPGIHLIHSVDSERIARELDKCASAKNTSIDCLIQVNTSEEASKSGVEPEKLNQLVKIICEQCPKINIRGLMTIGLLTEDGAETRNSFKMLNRLQNEMKQQFTRIDWRYLSMGMSLDFEIAIEEGANLLRIGTAVFGERVK